MIKVLYFAWVRERIGVPYEIVETQSRTVMELVEELKLLPKDSTDPRSYSVVVNELGNGIDTILESIALMT